MNRRQKIIVSVTGIFIVLLALVGLTYAYFLTRIQGNTSDKSISVTTANLSLVYGDGNGMLEVGEVLVPGNTVKFKTASGDIVDNKTFTVTNTGDDSSYVVVLEDVGVTYASAGTKSDGTTYVLGEETTFDRPQDFVYTLTCETNKSDTTCDGFTETVFPSKDGIIVGNEIKKGDVHTYTLTLTYKEAGVDQSNDMNKTLVAKVNIKDIKELNPYTENKQSLAYNIINNAVSITETQKQEGYAELVSNTKTKIAKQISETVGETGLELPEDKTMDVYTRDQSRYWTYGTGYTIDQTTGKFSLTGVSTCQYNVDGCRDALLNKYIVSINSTGNSSSSDQPKETTDLKNVYKITDTSSLENISYRVITNIPESVIATTPDDYGISYYYRGAVKNNYLEFNGMCWRIVRIEGDGSTKIVLAALKACSQITAEDTGSAIINFGDYGVTGNSNGQSFGNYESSSSTSMKTILNNFINGGEGMDGNYNAITYTPWSQTALNKLKNENICIGDVQNVYKKDGTLMSETEKQAAISNMNYYYYKNYIRLYHDKTASLMCDSSGNKTSTSKIYPLTIDEVVFAGGAIDKANYTFYLRDNAKTSSWRTVSLAEFAGDYDVAFEISDNGEISTTDFVWSGGSGIRPTVSLIPDIEIASGNGTINNPYVVN